MTANAQEMQHFTDIALLTNYVKIWYLGSAPISQTQHLKQATTQSYSSSGGMVYNRPSPYDQPHRLPLPQVQRIKFYN